MNMFRFLCDPLSFGLLLAAETRAEEMLIDTKMQMRRFIVYLLRLDDSTDSLYCGYGGVL